MRAPPPAREDWRGVATRGDSGEVDFECFLAEIWGFQGHSLNKKQGTGEYGGTRSLFYYSFWSPGGLSSHTGAGHWAQERLKDWGVTAGKGGMGRMRSPETALYKVAFIR